MSESLSVELRVDVRFSGAFRSYTEQLRSATERTEGMRKYTRQLNDVLRQTSPLIGDLSKQLRTGIGPLGGVSEGLESAGAGFDSLGKKVGNNISFLNILKAAGVGVAGVFRDLGEATTKVKNPLSEDADINIGESFINGMTNLWDGYVEHVQGRVDNMYINLEASGVRHLESSGAFMQQIYANWDNMYAALGETANEYITESIEQQKFGSKTLEKLGDMFWQATKHQAIKTLVEIATKKFALYALESLARKKQAQEEGTLTAAQLAVNKALMAADFARDSFRTYTAAFARSSILLGPLGASASATKQVEALAAGAAPLGAIAGLAHGGIDLVPGGRGRESTWILTGGERVLSPVANLDVTRAAEKINKAEVGAPPQITVVNEIKQVEVSIGGYEFRDAVVRIVGEASRDGYLRIDKRAIVR